MNAVAKRPSVGSHCYCFPHWPIPLPEKNFGRKLNIARDARTNKQTTKLLAYPILSIPIVLPLSVKLQKEFVNDARTNLWGNKRGIF